MSLKQIIILATVLIAVCYGYKEYTGKSLVDTVKSSTESVVTDTKNATIRVAENRKELTEQSNEAVNQ